MRRVCLILSVILLLTGCGKDNVEKKDMNNNMEELYVIAGNYDMKISNDAGQIGFKVNLLSKNKISKDDLSVILNTSAKYDYDLTELEKEEMPYYVFQCYKNVDWEKLKMLEADISTNLQFTEYQDKYVAEYNKSDKKKNFYYYQLEVLFNGETINQPEILKEIEVTYNNKTYGCLLGNVNLATYVERPDNTTEGNFFSLMTGGMYNINAFPNKDGELYTPENGLKYEGMHYNYQLREDCSLRHQSIFV